MFLRACIKQVRTCHFTENIGSLSPKVLFLIEIFKNKFW